MATAPTLPPALQDEITALFLSLEGLERARYLTVASFVVLLYDMMLTFDDEVRVPTLSVLGQLRDPHRYTATQVRFFWSGSWNLSRVLFLVVSAVLAGAVCVY